MDPIAALTSLRTRSDRSASTDAPALDADRDVVLLLDAALCIESANGTAARVLGIERDELVGKPVAAVLGRPGRRLGVPQSLAELFRDARVPASLPLVLVSRSGDRIDVQLTRIRLGGGEGEKFLCIARPLGQVPVRLPRFAPRDEADAAVLAGTSRSILVVAYSRLSRRLLEGVLERQGHEVETATTGVDAVARVATGSFDLVLVEGRLPDLSADDLVDELRARCGETAPRVIGMVTPDADPTAFDAVTSQPLRPAGLARAIRSAFRR